jgi:hypothetical protein
MSGGQIFGATSESTAFAVPTAGSAERAEAVRGEDFRGSAPSGRDRPGRRGNVPAHRGSGRGQVCHLPNPSLFTVSTNDPAGVNLNVGRQAA